MANSKPAGVSDRTISRTASGWWGENRILGTVSSFAGRRRAQARRQVEASRSGERDGGRDDRLVSDNPRGVALARRILDQPGVAGSEDVFGAIAQTDLELTRKDDDELPARRRMPVQEPAHRPLPKRDLGRGQPLLPVRHFPEIDRFDVGLTI